jgi:hypothetical protein
VLDLTAGREAEALLGALVSLLLGHSRTCRISENPTS